MRVLVLQSTLDAFKGANHLPLFAALPEIQFTILTNRTKPEHPDLPPNVTVETLNQRLGSYYYGFADHRFATAVLRRYPVGHAFWQSFDVIHLNQTMGLPLLQLPKTGRPVLYLVHHPVSVDRALALEESHGLDNLSWRLKYLFLTRWQRQLCRTFPHIVTVSSTVRDRLVQDYGCEASAITIVPNGVDGDIFQPADLAHTDFDVIAVGSLLHPRKGFRYLLDAYRLLASHGYRIADVGRRSDRQQAALRQIPGVQMFGMVEHDHLLTLLQRSATLLSCSLYEGFGLSLIEALACGRPAFAFAAGAVGEVLQPIDPTLVVPLRGTASLVKHMTDFLSLPVAERVTRGEAYRRAVLERYPLSASARRLRAVYERLCI